MTSEEKRANLFIEVYCNYDGAALKVAGITMEGHRLKIKVRSCNRCMTRNMQEGVKLVAKEIQSAALKPIETMMEVTK